MRQTLILVAGLATAAAAMAQAPTEERSISRIGPKGDPNQIICVRQAHIQSPLDFRRICRTRAEWGQLRQDTREVIERVQTLKPG
ncbi:MAG: hypothetical protein M3177_03915 [Pseudomonadota bacterium]|nr:hypothetical protein [Pseudomonadota bacterium]